MTDKSGSLILIPLTGLAVISCFAYIGSAGLSAVFVRPFLPFLRALFTLLASI